MVEGDRILSVGKGRERGNIVIHLEQRRNLGGRERRGGEKVRRTDRKKGSRL